MVLIISILADYVAATVKGDRDKIPEKARDTKEAADSLVGPAKKAALRTGFAFFFFFFFL